MFMFTLKPPAAKMLAGIAKATPTKSGKRPTMDSVCVEWSVRDAGDLADVTFVATDSYMLAYRQFTIDLRGEGEGDAKERVLVNGKQFAAALKEAVKGSTLKSGILVGYQDGTFVVARTDTDWSLELPAQDGDSYPSWRKLLVDDLTREYDGTLPAWNAGLMRRALDTLGMTPTELRDAVVVTRGEGHLKPMFLTLDPGKPDDGEWLALVMPVRS